MMGERPPPDPLRLGDTSGSSTGWTDEKHMLYITSLEESFVTQLYNGEGNSKGLSCRSPGARHRTYNRNGGNAEVHQAVYLGSLSCSGYQENDLDCYMDDGASTNGQQERTNYHLRPKNSGSSAASYLRTYGRSLFRTTESSDQNFLDGETEGCSEKRLRHAADTEVAPSGSTELQQDFHDLGGNYSGTSSGPATSSRKAQGPKRWHM